MAGIWLRLRVATASSSIRGRWDELRLRGNPAWHVEQHSQTGRSEEMKRHTIRYAIVIEKAKSNYAAYVPDLPGCVATGQTREETEQQIRQAVELHLQGVREDGLPIPEPVSQVEHVEVPA